MGINGGSFRHSDGTGTLVAVCRERKYARVRRTIAARGSYTVRRELCLPIGKGISTEPFVRAALLVLWHTDTMTHACPRVKKERPYVAAFSIQDEDDDTLALG